MFSWRRKSKLVDEGIRDLLAAVGWTGAAPRQVQVSVTTNSTLVHVILNPGEREFIMKVGRPGAIEGYVEPTSISLPSVSSRNQEAFRARSPATVCVPRVIHHDDVKGILVMEYVGGRNLKKIFSGKRLREDLDLGLITRHTADALASWHALSINEHGEAPSPRASSNFDSVLSFIDFSVWNIVVIENPQSICLLDFPGSDVWTTIHRDLATFLHSLLVVQHHPMVKFLKGQWWEWTDIYGRFLDAYGTRTGVRFTHEDFRLIRRNLQEIVAGMISKYRLIGFSLRTAFEAAWYSRLQNHPVFRQESLSSLL